MSRFVLKIGKVWISVLGLFGLLAAFQMLGQGQLDVDVELTPYELAAIATLFSGALVWAWVRLDRPVRTPSPIAEDTARWHFGRNAPILALGVVAFLVVVAVLSTVLPTLDPVINTTVSRFVAVPLALLGVADLAIDQHRRRRSTSTLNDDPRAL